MHELSIAMSIIEIAQEEAAARGGVRVLAVRLKLGELTGVVKEALLSSYEMAAYDTSLKESQLLIDTVPVSVYCKNCRSEQVLKSIQEFCCPLCGTPTAEIIHGRELEVVALEIAA